MVRKKIIISGVSADMHDAYYRLVEDVRACIEPTLQSSVDASVLGRFAVTEMVNSYISSPNLLASKLGFTARNHD